LGYTAGATYMFELTRDAGNASDTLSGDLAMLQVGIEFT